MCRGIHCIASMSGIPQGLLAALLGQFPPQETEAEPDHAMFLQQTEQMLHTHIRASEAALLVLKKGPPLEGGKLIGLDVLTPHDPDNVGVATIATYELPSGGFVSLGTDHLTQEVVTHSTPNAHGLEGLVRAMRQEMTKKLVDKEDQPEEKEAQAAE